MEAARVFIAHHVADEGMLRALVKHLAPLVAAKRIEVWDATRIPPGSDWSLVLERELSRAHLAIALVSADFLASEAPHLLQKRHAAGLHVVPVLARPCLLDDTWLADLQPLPAPGRSIAAGRASQQESDLADIAQAIAKLVEKRPAAPAQAVQQPSESSGKPLEKAPAQAAQAAPIAKPPAPRVLVAGPWFGIPPLLRQEIRRVWQEGPPARALGQIGALVRRNENDLLAAHLAAISRYSAVVDASPWRAFALRRSLGFRDGETASADKPAAWQGDGTPIGFFAFAPADLPAPADLAPAGIKSRVETLSERAPWLAALLRARADQGVAVSGFDATDAAWWATLAPLFGPVAVLADTPLAAAEIPPERLHRWPVSLDAPLTAPTLDDYARALRVVAGQVRLSGDDEERVIEQVYAALEVTTRESERRADRPKSEKLLIGQEMIAEGAVAFQSREPHESDEVGVLRVALKGVRGLSDFDSSDRPDAGEAEAELAARRHRNPPVERRIPAESLPGLAPRIMLWGKAGTGKSTLLQWLACRTLGSARVPVWVPRIASEAGDLEDQLARLALRAVGLPEAPSPAREALRAAMAEGRAQLFLDGLDEASPTAQTALHERLATLKSPALVASRPNVPGVRAAAHGFIEVTLSGLAPGAAERFLHGYFDAADWIGTLLRELHHLPEGPQWARTPVLLALAANLYRRAHRLPDATLDLYREVVHTLFRRACERADVPATESRIRDAETTLSRLARRMLLPTSGDLEIVIPRGEVDPLLLASGLFTGQTWLRFAHLTIGEFLAAKADISLTAERARLEERKRSASEVLPIAHALRGSAELEAALLEAEAGDTTDHLRIGLVLRAVAYGGEHVATFAKAHAPRVLRCALAELHGASGRFGEHEERLAEEAEKAFALLAPGLDPDDARVLESVAAGHGRAALEGLIWGWAARLLEPRRHPAFGRSALRAGKALAPRLESLTALHAFTDGEFAYNVRAAAFQALASDAESKPLLQAALRDDDFRVRAAAVQALASDAESKPLLRAALRDDDSDVRAAAVQALASDAESKPPLQAALRDDDSHVRAAAVKALASDAESKPLLQAALRDDDFRVRAAAVQALASDAESKPLLQAALRDDDSHVRAAAVKALASDAESKPLLQAALRDDDSDVRAAAVKALASDAESKPLLQAALRDDAFDVRAAAVKALAFDAESKPLLRAALRDGDSHVRAAAVKALAFDAESKPLLQAALRDDAFDVRAAAVQALASDAESKPLLQAALRDDAFDVRAAAVKALASDAESKPLLRAALRDDDFRVRAAAVRALASDAESKPLLQAALRDDDFRVRAAAVRALASDAESKPLLQAALRGDAFDVRAAAVRALASDAESKPLLQAALRDDDFRVRAAAVRALASDAESKPLLQAALRDNNFYVRAAAVQALASDAESKPLLQAALRDDDSDVRAAAVQALASDAESKPLLQAALRDDASDVRAAAVRALASDAESKPLLQAALRDNNFYVRAAAVQALASDAESKPLLQAALRDDDSDVRAAAVQALASDAESKPLLQAALRNDNFYVRAAAVQALASDTESKPLLQAALRDDDSHVRAAAVKALASDAESKPLLRAALRDDDSHVRAAAFQAFGPVIPERATPLHALPATRLALRLLDRDPTPDLPLDRASGALEARLRAFVRAPRPLLLDRDPGFAEALLGWLCIRMGQVHKPTAETPAVFGELSSTVNPLLDATGPIVLRVAMAHNELRAERSLLAVHNVIEAWRIARHLFTERDVQIWLACADVDFADLVPPPPGEWSCGNWHAGPTFFGFRLPTGSGPALDPWVEVLTSADAAERWSLLGDDEHAKVERTLAELAADPSLDPWTLVPALGRIGHLLPADIRASLAARLPTTLHEAAERLDLARQALGAAPGTGATSETTSGVTALAEAPATVRLAAARDAFDRALAARALDDAAAALEQAVAAAGPDTGAADLDDIVRRLDRLRDRMRSAVLAQRLAKLVPMLAMLPLERAASERLAQVSHRLALFLKV